jgi:hypothetical protein
MKKLLAVLASSAIIFTGLALLDTAIVRAINCGNVFPTALNGYVTGCTIPSAWANALEAKIGANLSAVTSSLDYQINHNSSGTAGQVSVFNGTNTNTSYPSLYFDSTNGVLQVNGGAFATGGLSLGTSSEGYQLIIGTSSPDFVVAKSGNVGIGTASPAAQLDLESTNTSGNLVQVGTNVSTTVNGAITGQNIDLSTNYTSANENTTGQSIVLPASTNTTGTAFTALSITGNTTTQNTGGATTWRGIDIEGPSVTQNAGTINETLLQLNNAGTTSGTFNFVNFLTGGTSRFLMNNNGQATYVPAGAAANNWVQNNNSLTSGIGTALNSTAAALTTGGILLVDPISTAITGDFSGVVSNVSSTHGMTAAATRTISGNEFRVNPLYQVAGTLASIMNVTGATVVFSRSVLSSSTSASARVTVTGDVLDVSNPAYTCTASSTCSDNSNVENISQQNASSTGAVLKVANSGSGATAIFTGGAVNVGTSTTSTASVWVSVGTTSTIAIGNPGIGKLCFWNGANFTIQSFASSSITPSYATSTTCQ